jgi:hypothetical protein
MKIQDVIFVMVFILLMLFRKERWFLYVGLACFIVAIPLFSLWIFFTADRLTWYGVAFIFVYLLIQMYLFRQKVARI